MESIDENGLPIFNQEAPILSSVARQPTETLQHIFQNIHDNRSLLACLLVNRQWCGSMVPIIWAYPKIYIPSSKPISVYAGCMDEITLNFIKSIIGQNLQEIPTIITPSFPYASYLQTLDVQYLFESIRKWLFGKRNPQTFSKNEKDCLHNVAQELFRFFFQQSVSIKKVLLGTYRFPQILMKWSDQRLLDQASLALRNVCTFHIGDFVVNFPFIKTLSKNCHTLTRLHICSLNDGQLDEAQIQVLSGLVRKQHRLRHLSIDGDAMTLAPIVFPEMFVANWLQILKFYQVDFRFFNQEDIDPLKFCYNLRALDLWNCSEVNDLSNAAESFSNLEYFSWYDEAIYTTSVPKDLFHTVLRVANQNLKAFRITNLFADESVSQEIVEALKTHGKNIHKLHIGALNSELVIHILPVFNHLEELHFCATQVSNENQFFEDMSKNIPKSLKYLSVDQPIFIVFGAPVFLDLLKYCPNLRKLHLRADWSQKMRKLCEKQKIELIDGPPEFQDYLNLI
ncbi:hypothetical protein G9A89_015257 [Geosiphon pyriformis]|nr:hypothetical protein G9A89_015257 [Geosiphon pyriformis]